ncbi:class I SAM-dependent methyltransferase [Sanguibacter antarcticus]|uniref:16S rRNA (Guanine1207-N2)-methyltransferase n=1 Tax=Sanguibacter antarcticus TaxID=372484 RepID=A0A2A9E9L3_9MICO|nr:class I SAM-dependent methyltransferase [Sanguibacter antarcticus]PFG34909.1 16S rRNA (guanine1207-N2)-methyltransferase [Sanguibacter antarcticus]
MPTFQDSLESLLTHLGRYPCEEGAGPECFDGVDKLLLRSASADLFPVALESSSARESRRVVVLDDEFGALTLGSVSLGAGHVRVHQDALTSERALARNAERLGMIDCYTQAGSRSVTEALGPDLLNGAEVVLLRLPKSLDALDEIAQAVARHASPDVVFYAGGRVKHMSRGMNDTLARSFGDVHASLGAFKSRALVARAPRTLGAPTFPRTALLDELGLTVVAHGGVFAGTRLDLGTRFLLTFLSRMAPDARDAVDAGCGSGILSTVLARSRPDVHVVATDQSAAAVWSARATAAANGVGDRVEAVRDDALSSLPDASADLVVCNPPFHAGTALHTDTAQRMFDAAGRVLRPGGELWTVYNSHLTYKRDLARAVGPTTMMGQDPRFTVTRSRRP